jgi:hypothetical protein
MQLWSVSMKKSVLFHLLAVLMLPALLPAQSSQRGIVLSSRDGQFTVTLPIGFDKPERESEESQGETGTVRTTTYTSGNERGVCLVSFSIYPKELFQLSTPEQMLDNAREGAFTSTEGTLEKQEDFTFEGHQGRTIYFSALNEGQQLYSRFDWIIAEPCLYQVAFVGFNREELDAVDIQEYFQSFALTRPKTKKK